MSSSRQIVPFGRSGTYAAPTRPAGATDPSAGCSLDAYAFVRETNGAGLERLAGLVGEQLGVVTFVPLIGAYSAFVKVSDDDPVTVRNAFTAIADIDDLLSVDTMVGSSPAARGGVQFPALSPRLQPARLTDSVTSAWGLKIPPLPPLPMPTHAAVGKLVAFVHLTTEPGQSTEVYLQASLLPGVVGLCVVSGLSVGVLVEVTAEDEHALGFATETVTAVDGVADVSISVGVTESGIGFGRL